MICLQWKETACLKTSRWRLRSSSKGEKGGGGGEEEPLEGKIQWHYPVLELNPTPSHQWSG